MDNMFEEMPVQEVDVKDVGKFYVKHHLVNMLHDGKERLIMAQHKVATYHQQGIVMKPPGFGNGYPKTYNQESSLSAQSILFQNINTYSLSPMHMKVRIFEAVWNAAIELVVGHEPCTKPCTLHPGVYQGAPGTKSPRPSVCEAKEISEGVSREDRG